MISLKKTAIALLAGTMTLTMALTAFANPSDYPGKAPMTAEQEAAWKQKREARRQEMKKALGLSAEQSSKLDAIRDKNRGKARELREEIGGRRRSLMEYMSSADADAGKAKAMQQEIMQLETKLSELKMNTWFEMRKILTPEQQTKMKAFRDKHGCKDGHHGRPGGPHGAKPPSDGKYHTLPAPADH